MEGALAAPSTIWKAKRLRCILKSLSRIHCHDIPSSIDIQKGEQEEVEAIVMIMMWHCKCLASRFIVSIRSETRNIQRHRFTQRTRQTLAYLSDNSSK